jgi:hypothetical protein
MIEAFARDAVPAGPVPTTIRLRQFAEMRLHPRDRWRPMTAEQEISVDRPGFVWLAQTKLMPFGRAGILDAYLDDEGLLDVRLFGSIPLARAAGPAAPARAS